MGCKCSECYGLREYMLDLTGKDYGLKPAPGHTADAPALPGTKPCDGSMTCRCEDCENEKLELIVRRYNTVKQPWEIAA